jgi:tetratricopeptide (TPR) repeat protein
MKLVPVLLAALLVLPVPARAQRAGAAAPRNARELIKQAEKLFEQKKYLEAAEALAKANELSPDSRLIYNMARAYDQAGQVKEAISYYEQYMTEGDDAQLRKRARSSIDRLRLQQEREAAATAEAEAERKRLHEEAQAAEARMRQERETARLAEEANQQRLTAAYQDSLAARRRMQVTSFALGGVAVVGAGLGTVFGLQARSARADFDAATTLDAKVAARDTTRSKALVADIGFGVGLVSAVAAVLLYPKNVTPPPGQARLISAPAGSGAGVEVRF